MKLEDLGYNSDIAYHFDQLADHTLSPCRVSLEQKGSYYVLTQRGEIPAIPTGKILYESDDASSLPVVGDWVACRVLDERPPKAIIHHILPRKSQFSRKEAGKRIKLQPVAANIDTVFIVMGLDDNFRPARVERYLALAWESGAMPVVLLTKADLCDNVDAAIDSVRNCSPGVDVHAISATCGTRMDAISNYLDPGRVVALLGSSGVGKSTIINYLLGDQIQVTQEVRDDSRGRHTTTHRQLFVSPSGGLIIDTPGMRELQLWNADEGLSEAFADIEALAVQCRFRDCQHIDEPGCAVRDAVTQGTLDERRFENYVKMRGELRHLELKQDAGAARTERMKWKSIHKQIRKMNQQRDR